MRPTMRRSPQAIARQWDRVASLRDFQIRSGQDLSYKHVLVPTLLSLAEKSNWSRVLDVGCGTGAFTERLSKKAKSVVGIDPSRCSIAIAQKSATHQSNTKYVNASIESFADNYEGRLFTLAVANMVLQDTPTLSGSLGAIARLLGRGGTFVCTITHPCFWPSYWGYDKEKWFNYNKEIAIVAPFRTSAAGSEVGLTTHFHRPIAQYTSTLLQAGFEITSILEPMPTKASLRLYPKSWDYPRFLAFCCRRTRKRVGD